MKQAFFILVLIFSSINNIKATEFVASTTAPIKIAPSGHIIVDVNINGKFTQPFIIDTGANSVTIPQSLFNKLNIYANDLKVVREIGGNGSYDVKSFNLGMVKVGDAYIADLEGTVSGEPIFIPGFDGVDMGVLPNNFLKQYLTELDLQSLTVTFHDKKQQPSSLYPKMSFAKTSLDIKMGNFIDLPIKVKDKNIISHFDTGAGNTLFVNWLAANELGYSKEDNNVNMVGQGMGTDGQPFDIYGLQEKTTVTIAGVSFETRLLIADMSVFEVMGGGARSNLGLGIFKEHKLFINYESKLMYFSKEVG
jgi:predicted aspartyl protease